ncbi:MAG: hypothetical protein KKE44_01160 [Proteobacteria bacterium]|nr:hypothetical protein [Pseudomonadota bacterium]MBU1581336.1 hypothetical protein [Pseudomonadota bacterium]MBU2452686.1 hypothetical protein [Pseudomonadota bacterium]MBU2630030.1 hypothetical protein [Pseudomonadota bacterium]
MPKVTQPNIKYIPSEPPKITPEKFNPNNIKNLPGKKLPISERLSKETKGAVSPFDALRHILKLLESGTGGAPVIMVNPVTRDFMSSLTFKVML